MYMGLTTSPSGTAYVRRCLAAGVMPGQLPGGPDPNIPDPNGVPVPNGPPATGPAAATQKARTAADDNRDDLLAAMKISQNDLKSMTPKERQALEEKIQRQAKAHAQNDPSVKAGVIVNIQA